MQLDGRKIRWLRENKGWSARELCRAASLSKSYLSQIEHDDRGCSPSAAARLAAALDTSIVDLRRNGDAPLEAID